MELPSGIDQAFKNIAQVRLKGGVVGKASTVLIVVCLSVAAMVVAVKAVWVAAAAILLLVGFCYLVLNKLIDFANRNPTAALMEGAEFLAHQQLVHGRKQNPSIDVNPKDFMDMPGTALPHEKAGQLPPPEADADDVDLAQPSRDEGDRRG